MNREITKIEGVALLVWHLAHGEGMRTIDAARCADISHRTAGRWLNEISRVIPIHQDDEGFWAVCAVGEAGV